MTHDYYAGAFAAFLIVAVLPPPTRWFPLIVGVPCLLWWLYKEMRS